MNESLVDRTQPWLLAPLMGLSIQPPGAWTDRDLGDILAHQLAVPLQFGLQAPGGPAPPDLTPLTNRSNPPIRTFGDLLFHPAPPLDLLRLAKDFAKSVNTGPESAFPRHVAAVLYYGVILVARLRHGKRIWELDDRTLAEGANWALGKPWVDPRTRGLFEDGLTLVERERRGDGARPLGG